MKEQLIGEVISQRRRELGLTQEELCEGLCESATLSRLENGRQTPSRSVVNALLERLGLPGDRFYALLTPQEVQLEALQGEIISLSVRFQEALEPEREQVRQQSWEKLTELKKIVKLENRINRQFLLRTQVILGREDGTPHSFQERMDLLMEAIRLTVPRFTLERLALFRYTLDDMKVLNQIALTFSRDGQREEALEIYRQLLQYVKTQCKGGYQAARPLCLLAHNYAGELRMCERYSEALDIARQGIDACVHYGHYEFLGGITHTMAECYHFLGDDQKSIDCFHRAYYLYEIVNNERGIALLQADAQAYFKNLQYLLSSLNGLFR